MAAPSSFAAALRRCISRNPSSSTGSPSAGFFLVERSRRTISSGSSRIGDPEDVHDSVALPEDSLRDRIFRLRFPKRSATAVLERWINEKGNVTAGELRRIARDLRRAQRFKHALEISEWMVSHCEHELSENDYAERIGLISTVFGLSSAEEFFHGLPLKAKTSETYTALIHAYARAKLVENAEILFEKMKNSGIHPSTLTFNEMMTLYISVGQPEKVPLIVDQLKNSGQTADLFSYNLWISAVASGMDTDAVRRVLHEMSSLSHADDTLMMYIKLAEIYISMTEKMISYDFLLILQGCMGKKEKVDEIWKSLKMTSKIITRGTYVSVLSSYLIHGYLKEAGEILDEWEKDKDMCERLYHAILKADLISVAENFSQLLSERDIELIGAPDEP